MISLFIKKHFYFLVIPALLSTQNLLADEIELQSRVVAATVYPRTAEVTREAIVEVGVGEHQLVLSGLPNNLEAGRVRIEADNKNLILGSVDIKQIHAGEFLAEEEKRLRLEIQELSDQKTVLTDQVDTANLQILALNELAKNSGNALENEAIGGSGIADLIAVIAKDSLAARKSIREATIAMRDLNAQIQQKNFELSQIATRQKRSSEVTVNVKVSQAGSTKLHITYPQQNANWHWLYEARLNTESKNLNLLRQAAVTQVTGEDWTNAAVTLSTSRPTQNAVTPELYSRFVDLRSAITPRSLRRRAAVEFDEGAVIEEIIVTASMMPSPGRIAPMETLNADVFTTKFLAEYQIPGIVTIVSGGQEKILPVDTLQYPVQLVVRTVPEFDDKAYLEASFELDQDDKLEPGRFQLYRDGAFVGAYAARDFYSNEEIRLPFGVDRDVQVKILPEEKGSGDRGAFRRTSVEQQRLRYEIVNHHASPITVEVLGRVPVTENKKIDVVIPKTATVPTEKDFEGDAGILLWKFDLAGGENKSIQHYFDVRYPADESIEYE